MKVFVTGATGYIGEAVVRRLAATGRQVFALVRNPEKKESVEASGGIPVLGNLRVPESYMETAKQCDVLIHAGFEMGADAVKIDRLTVETLLKAAKDAGVRRSVIYTSGVMVLGNTGDTAANENAPTDRPAEAVAWRPRHESIVLEASSAQLASAVIRPGMVYGGKKGIMAGFFQSARDQGEAMYVGDGKNRWGLVHVADLAELYRLVAEKQAGGIFHAVEEMPVRVKDIASIASEAAGKGGKTRSIPVAEARTALGAFADALCLDQVVGAKGALELGWRPQQPPFPESIFRAYQEWAQ